MAKSKVVVGMSGGMDSTLTAILLKESGYDVVGITLLMWDNKSIQQAICDAKLQASSIGIEHYVVDCSIEFKKTVVSSFIKAYLNGQTPSPCAHCNPEIKWRYILDFANSIDAEYISSGHYIETTEYQGHHYIVKGSDPVKDQSYYLWNLPEKFIKRMIQPLGKLKKEQTKQKLAERNYSDMVPNRESMGICFLSGSNYRDFLYEFAPDEMKKISPGKVLDENGTEIGKHKGIPFYTIGQKRDLELDSPREAYVKSIDSQNNTITIANKAGLLVHSFEIHNLHFINPTEITPETPLEIKVRGLGLNPEGYGFATIRDGKGIVTLQNPAWAIAPGQPVVFYIGNRLVGGGLAL